MEERKNILKFEGAGWEKAECNQVGNCRLRTRIKNKEGDLIYFECTYLNKNGNHVGFVSHCFNCKDERTNYTKELSHIESLRFTYSDFFILKFINENLNCNFTEMKVYNEGLRIHDTEKELCSCYER